MGSAGLAGRKGRKEPNPMEPVWNSYGIRMESLWSNTQAIREQGASNTPATGLPVAEPASAGRWGSSGLPGSNRPRKRAPRLQPNDPEAARRSLTPPRLSFRIISLPGSQPVVPLGGTRRLRVLHGSAADPSNLLQVMLAKGTLRVFPTGSRGQQRMRIYVVTVD